MGELPSRRKSLIPGDPLMRRSRDSVTGASTASTVPEMFRTHVVLDAVVCSMVVDVDPVPVIVASTATIAAKNPDGSRACWVGDCAQNAVRGVEAVMARYDRRLWIVEPVTPAAYPPA
jgi:hypothetical protein